MTDAGDCLLKGDFVLCCDYETEIKVFIDHLSDLPKPYHRLASRVGGQLAGKKAWSNRR